MRPAPLLTLALAAAAGCGPGDPPRPAGLSIRGHVLRDGKPLANAPGDGQYDLYLLGLAGNRVVMALAPDGTFAGPHTGQSLTAGAYKAVLIKANSFGGSKDRPPVLNARAELEVTAEKADGYVIDF